MGELLFVFLPWVGYVISVLLYMIAGMPCVLWDKRPVSEIIFQFDRSVGADDLLNAVFPI
jgi:hypothetical protein